MIISADKNGRIDPVWYNLFREIETSIPIIIITRLENYQFNDELLKLDRYLICCGCEYDWNEEFKYGTHFFGKNTFQYKDKFKGDEWDKFDEFVTKNPPLIYFKRELLDGDKADNVFPINYPCWYEIPKVQSKAEFDSRPLQVFNCWGLSHHYRTILHGEIWRRCGEFGYVVGDNIDNIDKFIANEGNPKKWLTVNSPWYARKEMNKITDVNELSKISISVAGAGRHCFRHSESPMASVMYLWDDGINYSYPWIHNVNCIMSKQGEELKTIVEALNNPNLSEIYLNGVENCKNYYLPTYQRNYIEKIILNF